MTRFRNDPVIQHRHRQRRLEDTSSYAHTGGMWQALTKRVGCPVCGADPDQPCISQAKDTPGEELKGFHQQRTTEARRKFGRKKA